MVDVRRLALRLAAAAKSAVIEPGRFVSKVASNGRPTKERSKGGDLGTYESIYRGDPLVGAIIDWKAVRVLGRGLRIRCYNANGDEVPNHEIHTLFRNSKPYSTLDEFIRNRYWGGTGYLELDDQFTSFRAVSPTKMKITVDDDGNVTEYTQEIGGTEPPKWTGDDVKRIIRCPNRSLSDRKSGISDIESIAEIASILRDMQIDLSNFVESKAYSPIIFMLGTKERPWSKDDVDKWNAAVSALSPGDVMAVSGDVDFKIPDVTGIDIGQYLNFFAALMVSGLKVPGNLTSIIQNIDSYGGETQELNFKYFIASERKKIGEALELDLFQRMIEGRGYSDIVRVEVEWLKHEGEEERLAVNSVIQLLQNHQVSHETADKLLALPDDARKGTLLNLAEAVDTPEGSDPTIHPEVDQNRSSDLEPEEDTRHGSPRRNVK